MTPHSLSVRPQPLTLAVLIAGLCSCPAFAQNANGGTLSYRDDHGYLGLGVDDSGNITGELKYLIAGSDTSGTVGELWASDRAGGVKLSYNWIPALADGKPDASKSIRKVFGAVDQNAQYDRKLTLGGGFENGDGYIAGYVSRAITGSRQVSTESFTASSTVNGTDNGRPYIDTVTDVTTVNTYEHPFDWGVGARAGRYLPARGLQFGIGADHEWGRNGARQTTVSMDAVKYFRSSPWSINLRAEALTGDKGLASREHDVRAWFMVRYALGHAPRTPVTYPVAAAGLPAPTPADQPPEAAPPAKPAPAKFEKRLVKATASMSADTFFKFDSAALSPAADQVLGKVIGTLTDQGYVDKITLTGHTCNIGTEAYNMKLSIRRAQSVKKYLVDNGHIPPDDIVAIGKGESDPTYPNTRTTRYKNRRVDLEFLTYVNKEELVPVSPAPPGPAEQKAETAPAVVWHREVVEPEPDWIQHGLFDTIPHKRTVDYYRYTTQTVTSSTSREYVNRNPLANDDSYTISNGQAMALAVLGNDSDPDNDSLTITSVTQPALGKAIVSGSSIVYTPNADVSGSDSFSYTVSDGKGGTATATVRVTLVVNHAPVAVNDTYIVYTYGTHPLDVLANDYDPDQDPISIVSFTQPAQGSVSLNGNVLDYTYSTPFTSSTFTYTISDGNGGTSSAVVNIVDP